FYDPIRLATASRTSEPGVLVRRIPCGPWVQLLHWVDSTSSLVIVQNVREGRGWRLTLISDLQVADYRAGNIGVRLIDFPGSDNEWVGYAGVKDQRGLFVTSSQGQNVTFATTSPKQ